MRNLPERIADGITTYTKSIIVVVLVLTLLVGAGMPMVDQESDTEQFETDSPAANAQEYIEEHFVAEGAENETTMQLIQRGEDVLTQDALIESLEIQQEILNRQDVAETLVDEDPIVGIPNLIAAEALQPQAAAQPDDGAPEEPTEDDHAVDQEPPSIEDQIAAIEALDDAELEAIVQDLLGADGDPQALALMPASYEPGSTTAQAQNTIIRQEVHLAFEDPEQFPDELTDAQLEIRDIAADADHEYSLFGFGILTHEIDQSLADSGAIVGPLALLFVVLALTIAYRDVLDIVLGVVGILTVLVWTFGFMGWMDIAFNQLLLSVPVLLIGLSIDYAIHVFMRHREQRANSDVDAGIRPAMLVALAGVGAALVWVTATAAIGFLANLTSPIEPLQEFGIVSAFGVVAALIVFGALIPALKIELDSLLEARGFDRQKRAFGTGESRFSTLLSSGATAARRFPAVIVLIAILLTVAGAYGATQVETSFDEQDFLAEQPADWTQELPEPFAPGTYQITDDLDFIGENYQQEDNEAEVLIQGEVTHDETLRWLDRVGQDVAAKETLFVGPDGPDIRSPLTIMQRTAAIDPAEATFDNADDGEMGEAGGNPDEEALLEFQAAYNEAAADSPDGIPDQNLEELFGLLLDANPEASAFIYQNADGEIEALRFQFGVTGDARMETIADDNRAVADAIEEQSGSTLDAQAAGDQVIFDTVQQDLLDTVIQGLLITLVAVFLFLSIAYKATGNPASLGIVTLIPVAFAVSWILGSMWLLDIPFNTMTGTITSLTIGLGIAYSIHISSRYQLELRRQGNVWDAMQTTVTGTGGALLGSAATTVGGFGTLAFAILPILRQFGIITGLTIIYAFLASVLLLPSLLVLWTRYFGPTGYFPGEDTDKTAESTRPQETPAPDGGQE